jgi:hypothetical protein
LSVGLAIFLSFHCVLLPVLSCKHAAFFSREPFLRITRNG